MLSTKALLLSLVAFYLNYHVHHTGKEFYSQRTALGKTNPKVYDVGFKYLPDLSQSWTWKRIADGIPTLVALVFVLNNDFEPLAKATSYMITMHAIRSVFIASTILPKVKTCDDSKYTIHNFLNGNCYDKIFSGHMASVTMLFLVLNEYNRISPFLATLGVVMSGIITIATRNHYTIDVLMGILVALGLHKTGFKII